MTLPRQRSIRSFASEADFVESEHIEGDVFIYLFIYLFIWVKSCVLYYSKRVMLFIFYTKRFYLPTYTLLRKCGLHVRKNMEMLFRCLICRSAITSPFLVLYPFLYSFLYFETVPSLPCSCPINIPSTVFLHCQLSIKRL